MHSPLAQVESSSPLLRAFTTLSILLTILPITFAAPSGSDHPYGTSGLPFLTASAGHFQKQYDQRCGAPGSGLLAKDATRARRGGCRFQLQSPLESSFGPSDKKERAQQASMRTSSSGHKSRSARVGSEERTSSKSGWGLPRQKFDKVQVASRRMLTLDFFLFNWFSNGCIAPACKTRSRHGGESPAMVPSATTACWRTLLLGLFNKTNKDENGASFHHGFRILGRSRRKDPAKPEIVQKVNDRSVSSQSE
jgi:hypothetical protein